MDRPPMSRSVAAALSLTRYFNGEPCPAGHLAERHVSNGRCTQCAAEWKRRNRCTVNAAQRHSRARDREVVLAKRRAAYHARPEAHRKAALERGRANAERRRAYARAYSARPEVRERINRRKAERLRGDPQFALNHRVRVRLRDSLRRAGSSKGGRAWADLLGYSVDDLRVHLERQFTKGMSWSNMADWEIDHVVPLAAFAFTSPDDPAFRAAWALTNLRPLSRPANRRKSAARTLLL